MPLVTGAAVTPRRVHAALAAAVTLAGALVHVCRQRWEFREVRGVYTSRTLHETCIYRALQICALLAHKPLACTIARGRVMDRSPPKA